MDLTIKFMECRQKYVKNEMTYTDEEKSEPKKWVTQVAEIRTLLNEIEMGQKEMESRFMGQVTSHYRDANSQVILNTRFQVKLKISKVNKLIKAFRLVSPSQTQDPEWFVFHSQILEGFSAKSKYLGQKFQDASSRYMDDFIQQITENKDSSKEMTAAQKIYEAAQKETDLIVREIMEIVELVNNLATCIYECGTILNRIEAHLTEAENYVDKGNANLVDIVGAKKAEQLGADIQQEQKETKPVGEAAQKLKEKVPLMALLNRVRYITYFFIAASFVIDVLLFAL